MITKTFRLLAATAAGIAFCAVQAAPTLLVSSGGILTGASGVLVDGVSYDVRFVDGSCSGLFNGCSTQAFAFTTSQAATDAAQALLDSVFVDGPLGNFDSNPAATNGCTASNRCNAFVPWFAYQSAGGLAAREMAAINISGSSPGGVVVGSQIATDDSTNFNDGVWAIFSTSATVAAVPEPGSISLCFAGAGALLAFSRRRRASVPSVTASAS